MAAKRIVPTAEERAIIAEMARLGGLPYRVVLGRLQAAVAEGWLDGLVSHQRLLYYRAMRGDVDALIQAGQLFLGQTDEG
jgi:hypothetical protein